MPLPANVSNAQQATVFGGTYVVNATGTGQGIGVAPPVGGQAANAQLANPSCNAFAIFLQGLALEGQAVAPAAASLMGAAQAAARQASMAAPQAVLQQQQPMPRPPPAVPVLMPPAPPAPRPLVRPLLYQIRCYNS